MSRREASRRGAVWVGLTGLAVLIGITAVAGPSALRAGGLSVDAPAPRVAEPLPFDHDAHEKTFRKERVTCVTCHPVGLRVDGTAPSADLPPPTSTCHGCHLHEVKGAPRKADGTCGTCHPDRSELVPVDHGLGWLGVHGGEARARGRPCTACHDATTCVDCHEGRGAMTANPHPPGFRATHGVKARLDPNSCSSCHVQDTCTACHTDGVTPW